MARNGRVRCADQLCGVHKELRQDIESAVRALQPFVGKNNRSLVRTADPTGKPWNIEINYSF